jgi:hypothetical protein
MATILAIEASFLRHARSTSIKKIPPETALDPLHSGKKMKSMHEMAKGILWNTAFDKRASLCPDRHGG